MRNLRSKLKKFFIPCGENNYRPGFLAGGTLFNVVLALLILKIVAVVFIAYFPKTVFFADLTKVALVDFTNQERIAMGVGQLKENTQLNFAAMQKAQDMLDNDYFSHQSPEGLTPWYWFKKVGYNYKIAGENLAIGFLDSQEVLDAWKNSPSHRENLLNPKFREIGIAVLKGEFQGAEATVVVQLLGTSSGSVKTEVKTVSQTNVKNTALPSQTTSPIKTNTPAPTENITPKTETEQNNVVAIKGETIIESSPKNEVSDAQQEKDWLDKLFTFMTFTYPVILQKIIFYTLLLITAALILNVIIRHGRQDKRLIAKTMVFIILLGLFVMSDKELLIQFIPHNLLI